MGCGCANKCARAACKKSYEWATQDGGERQTVGRICEQTQRARQVVDFLAFPRSPRATQQCVRDIVLAESFPQGIQVAPGGQQDRHVCKARWSKTRCVLRHLIHQGTYSLRDRLGFCTPYLVRETRAHTQKLYARTAVASLRRKQGITTAVKHAFRVGNEPFSKQCLRDRIDRFEHRRKSPVALCELQRTAARSDELTFGF